MHFRPTVSIWKPWSVSALLLCWIFLLFSWVCFVVEGAMGTLLHFNCNLQPQNYRHIFREIPGLLSAETQRVKQFAQLLVRIAWDLHDELCFHSHFVACLSKQTKHAVKYLLIVGASPIEATRNVFFVLNQVSEFCLSSGNIIQLSQTSPTGQVVK